MNANELTSLRAAAERWYNCEASDMDRHDLCRFAHDTLLHTADSAAIIDVAWLESIGLPLLMEWGYVVKDITGARAREAFCLRMAEKTKKGKART